ncbi:MAG: hypothetical protein Unbinned200contig1002_17 [Prokaryotic dsDNA virus sp.]|jgi:hypothetical protein|nr:hypothetical protein [Flavobacteriaceae bacterium]QDP68316.1 MAG: hypothetical protein Unbinned200contig1002_17 [Prokaryotic dsDNA virus sp.]|tara:strand:- start:8181 stop:8426 length:246 start_codon:yes stop_codon:yes gene_type:complete
MSNDSINKILRELGEIKTGQAVNQEQLKHIRENLDKGDKRFDEQDRKLERIDKRIDTHDKIFGGIVIASSILFTLIRFKIL